MTCTFFGHRNAPRDIATELRKLLVYLISEKGVVKFLVGNQGNFDKIVKSQLIDLKKLYPIDFEIVLAYLPDKKALIDEHIQTVFPEGIESIPPKFAINFRNKWMIEQADYVVTCVKYNMGGAAKFKEYAKKRNKKVINIDL